MKARVMVLIAGAVGAALVFAIFSQWTRYKEASQLLSNLQKMTPGKTPLEEVKHAVGEDFAESGNCPSGCTFSRTFNNMWLERRAFGKSLTFTIYVSVESGVVTSTGASFKVVGRDGWLGAVVHRSPYTRCKTPEESCTSVILGSDRHIPIRVISELPADPRREVTQPAYNFDLNCLLPFHRCATVDDIYPDWKRLPN